jgi:hypothetical protein
VSVIRDGNLLVAPRRGTPRIFLSQRQLSAQLAGRLPDSRTWSLKEVQWFGRSGFAAILVGRHPWETAVAVFREGVLETLIPEFGQRVSSLRLSPLGDLGFAHNQLGREFVMLTRLGREIPLPRIANARAIAWSPDERWVALSTRTTTFIAQTGTRRVVRQIAVGGEALDWTR